MNHAVFLSFLIAVCGARNSETDINPVGAMGELQMVLAHWTGKILRT
jgi:hypothetical protein